MQKERITFFKNILVPTTASELKLKTDKYLFFSKQFGRKDNFTLKEIYISFDGYVENVTKNANDEFPYIRFLKKSDGWLEEELKNTSYTFNGLYEQRDVFNVNDKEYTDFSVYHIKDDVAGKGFTYYASNFTNSLYVAELIVPTGCSIEGFFLSTLIQY